MVLSLFDYSGRIKNSFIKQGFDCLSLDISQNNNNKNVDIVTDILNWDYKSFSQDDFNFIFIALPCEAYSIASGAYHFKKNKIKSSFAVNAINILIRVYQITQYFGCKFIIENPTGGLFNNVFFKSFFSLNVTRLTLSNFGFCTRKQTDLFYNFDMLLIVPVTYRCNGRHQKYDLSNMSKRSRSLYPLAFADWIVENVIKNM